MRYHVRKFPPEGKQRGSDQHDDDDADGDETSHDNAGPGRNNGGKGGAHAGRSRANHHVRQRRSALTLLEPAMVAADALNPAPGGTDRLGIDGVARSTIGAGDNHEYRKRTPHQMSLM